MVWELLSMSDYVGSVYSCSRPPIQEVLVWEACGTSPHSQAHSCRHEASGSKPPTSSILIWEHAGQSSMEVSVIIVWDTLDWLLKHSGWRGTLLSCNVVGNSRIWADWATSQFNPHELHSTWVWVQGWFIIYWRFAYWEQGKFRWF